MVLPDGEVVLLASKAVLLDMTAVLLLKLRVVLLDSGAAEFDPDVALIGGERTSLDGESGATVKVEVSVTTEAKPKPEPDVDVEVDVDVNVPFDRGKVAGADEANQGGGAVALSVLSESVGISSQVAFAMVAFRMWPLIMRPPINLPLIERLIS